MFFGSGTASDYCWLRSANTIYKYDAWYVIGHNGYLSYNNYGSTYQARAAFKINLSQCSWAPAN